MSQMTNWKQFSPTKHNHPIIVVQTPHTRAVTVGYFQGITPTQTFTPARLHFGALREADTAIATTESLLIAPICQLLNSYAPQAISTITIMRETLACHLNTSLWDAGIHHHYGDAFIGATHIKGNGTIKTAYLYENTEGLHHDGLWIIADSVCMGRNLLATLNSLLEKHHPKEMLFICPIASRVDIDSLSSVIAAHGVSATFVAWGGLFGVDKKTLYNMPWGHPDTEPLDLRDQKLVVDMYGPNLCMGGDFGNNYYSPTNAKELYDQQIQECNIIPKIPSVSTILESFSADEFITH